MHAPPVSTVRGARCCPPRHPQQGGCSCVHVLACACVTASCCILGRAAQLLTRHAAQRVQSLVSFTACLVQLRLQLVGVCLQLCVGRPRLPTNACAFCDSVADGCRCRFGPGDKCNAAWRCQCSSSAPLVRVSTGLCWQRLQGFVVGARMSEGFCGVAAVPDVLPATDGALHRCAACYCSWQARCAGSSRQATLMWVC